MITARVIKAFIRYIVSIISTMPHLYCVSCKAQLDNCRHHSINSPLLKLYICARLGVLVLEEDRICSKCRSAFDYWRIKFSSTINDFIANNNERNEVSFLLFFSIFFYLFDFLDLQAMMEMNDTIDFNSSAEVQTEPVCSTIDLYIQRTSNSHR